VGKLENLTDNWATLPATALKFEASIVLTGMEKLAEPAGAAHLAERLQQKFNANVSEAGAIGYANFQISALLRELVRRSPQEALGTLTKLSDASEKYSDALLKYPADKLGDGMKLGALKLNIEVQTLYAKTSIAAKAKELGRSTESIAAEARSKAGPPPTPEIGDEFNRLMQAGS
jgi:hypothetical protein